MNWQENKFEISLMAGLGLALFGLFSLFRPIGEGRKFETQDIAYEMARPNSFTPAEYDLSAREVDRQYINPFEKVNPPAKPTPLKKTAVTPKKTTGQKTADKKSSTKNGKKPGADVKVVDATRKTLSDSEENSGPTTSTVTDLRDQNKQNAKKNENANDQTAKDQRSPDQWKALLLAEPTYDNMKKLMTAFSNKEIDEGNFYKILQSLIENQNPQIQSVGLYGAQGFPSARSFTLIAKNEDILNGNTKKFAEQILLAYNQPQTVAVLGQVLRGSDEAVVMKAGEVIMAGIQKYKNGESISEGNRTSRGSVVIKSASQYSVLVPALQQLTSNANPSVVQLANSVLSQIQSLLASSNSSTPSAG